MMKKKIMVTGCTGFIGSCFLERVKDKYDVVCLVRENKKITSKAKAVYGSLSDAEKLDEALKDVDAVVHLAAAVGVVNSNENYESNVKGTKNLVEACKRNNVSRIIYTSSVSVTRKKMGAYGRTKLMGEKVITESDMEYTILRPTMVYGKKSRGLKRILKYVNMFPGIVPIVGSGRNLRQPVYVYDVCEAIVKCLENGISKRKIYDLAGPDQISFNDLVDMINEIQGKKKIKIHVPAFICNFSSSLIEKILKNPPFTSENIRSLSEDVRMDISDLRNDVNYDPIKLKDGLKEVLGGH